MAADPVSDCNLPLLSAHPVKWNCHFANSFANKLNKLKTAIMYT